MELEDLGNCCLPATFEVCFPEASRTGPSQVTSKKLLRSMSIIAAEDDGDGVEERTS